jgi:hypothetical protein
MEDKQFCVICLSDKTTQRWWNHNLEGQRICRKCYRRFIWKGYKKSVQKNNDKQTPLKIYFKNRRITLKENPRSGICSICNKKIGEGIKTTNIHHFRYDDNDPLKNTEELCAGCHAKETIRLGQIKRDSITGRFTKK